MRNNVHVYICCIIVKPINEAFFSKIVEINVEKDHSKREREYPSCENLSPKTNLTNIFNFENSCWWKASYIISYHCDNP